MDDNDKLEKRAKMSARIYGFLKETMLAYDREGLGFDDFLADIPYALAFIFEELDNCGMRRPKNRWRVKIMDDNEIEKRAKMCARIYEFLNKTRLEYSAKGLTFEGFIVDVQYAIGFLLKALDEELDEVIAEAFENEEDEDDG